MLYRRNLWIYTIRTLRRDSCSNHPLSANFSPKFESSRVFSCSSFNPRESRVSRSYSYCYGMNYSVSGKKNFCSLTEKNSCKCWHCGEAAASKPFLACESCRTVQPVYPSVDYFQIYGLEKGYEIEEYGLERKYKDWQKKLHPDLVHTKSEKEKEYAAEQSARVIDAYRTLRKPLSRAIYLLSLEGVHVDEERTVSDPELLAEIMEIREAVEEAVNSQALKQIQNEVQGKLKNWSISFCNAFKNRKFEDAVTSIQRMTYYDRINEEIVKKL